MECKVSLQESLQEQDRMGAFRVLGEYQCYICSLALYFRKGTMERRQTFFWQVMTALDRIFDV
jgi:hypothetical protein